MLGPRIDRLTTPTPMNTEKAMDLAKQCQASDEDGWTYTVRLVGNGKAVVDVYDEESTHVGTF